MQEDKKTIRIHLSGVIMLMPEFCCGRLTWKKKLKAVDFLFSGRLYILLCTKWNVKYY